MFAHRGRWISPEHGERVDILAFAETPMIDSHVHVWTGDTKNYPRQPGAVGYEPAVFTPEDLFREARPAGVRRIVLVQMSFYGFDNSYMLDAIRAWPGTFSGIAVVDSNGANPASDMKTLAQSGVRGFRIQPKDTPATWLDTPGMESMWKCGAKEHLAMCALLDPAALESVDRMCRRHPDTPVVIDHLARIGIDGQVHEEDVRRLCALAKHRNVWVKVSAFYALGQKKQPHTELVPLIRRVVEAFGPRRVMWGSDSPFQVQPPQTYAASVALVRDDLPFLSADDRGWLTERTAEALFFRANR